jgi:hypothetical protein
MLPAPFADLGRWFQRWLFCKFNLYYMIPATICLPFLMIFFLQADLEAYR